MQNDNYVRITDYLMDIVPHFNYNYDIIGTCVCLSDTTDTDTQCKICFSSK